MTIVLRSSHRRPGRPSPVAALVALALLSGCGGETDAGGGRAFAPLRSGDLVPAYAAPRIDGDSLRLEELRGDVVILNVWATWCIPCREEMPALQEAYLRHRDDGLVIVGASIDGRGSERAVRPFVEEVGVTFPILLDPEERVIRAFRTVGVPETFLIDREGILLHRWVGPFDPNEEPHRSRIEEALATGTASE